MRSRWSNKRVAGVLLFIIFGVCLFAAWTIITRPKPVPVTQILQPAIYYQGAYVYFKTAPSGIYHVVQDGSDPYTYTYKNIEAIFARGDGDQLIVARYGSRLWTSLAIKHGRQHVPAEMKKQE